jgi:hypothetical protein
MASLGSVGKLESDVQALVENVKNTLWDPALLQD